MKTPPIVSREEWMAAREGLLPKEKELSRARDSLAAERRRMPWMAVDGEYWFDGPTGRVSLEDLFEGRRQLIVYRAFYGPEVTTYAEGGGHIRSGPASVAPLLPTRSRTLATCTRGTHRSHGFRARRSPTSRA
jgi:predicted dithiol-disulfide oxidoreductase (DUF899 family)